VFLFFKLVLHILATKLYTVYHLPDAQIDLDVTLHSAKKKKIQILKAVKYFVWLYECAVVLARQACCDTGSLAMQFANKVW